MHMMGKEIGVSGNVIDHATKVLKNAVPEVVKECGGAVPSSVPLPL